jgi:TRAP-type mannitol/chloroaromatic compound transport system permease large subunit
LASPRTPDPLPPGVEHSRRSAVLLVVGLIASTSPLPYTAVAVLPVIWAGVESVLSIRDRSTARSTAPATAQATARAQTRGIVSGVVSLVLACVITVMVLLPYAFYGTAKSLQNCTLGANTAIAAADCTTRFHNSLDSIFSGLVSSGRRAGG